MRAVRAKISAGVLAHGERLPSIRGLAAQMAVSPSTVVEAYDRLAAEGLIRARPGSGFYVSTNALPPLALAQAATRQERGIDPFWVSRQSLDADAATLKPGCGWLPADWMPAEALRKASRALSRAGDGVLIDYGGTRGSPALRRLLSARLFEQGIEVPAEQILLTASGTQALDLVCRYLLRAGDTVVVDDPCYFNFRALLRAHQVKIVGVPYTPSGPDVEAFESILASERPRLYLTNSGLHNPTGATLAAHVAHRLLNAAAQHGVTVVEDDIFADFAPEPTPQLAALDGLERVVHIGSFSKTLSASARCGYLLARPDWVGDLIDLQVATGFGGPAPVCAELVAHVLGSGGYRKHIDEVRRRLARARRDTAAKLQRLGIEPWTLPRGGFYLWCRLPDGVDSGEVARVALQENVVLAPGNVFSVSQSASAFMRFNVAQCHARALGALQNAIAMQSGNHQP
ncbi:MAG: PLP-dependent aminotransferase family protein [Pseudoxanthomonas sp.]